MPVAKKGWIALYRGILESDIWLSEEPFCYRSAWIDLLLLANHENGNAFSKIPVSRGQHLTSIRKLINRWHWHYRKVKRYLDILQAEGMVNIDTQSTYLLITITNYEKYQLFPGGNSSGNTNGNSSGKPSVNANGKQTIIINNDINNDKEIKAPPFSSSGWGDGEPE